MPTGGNSNPFSAASSSYQHGGTYRPPIHYAADQTKVMQDTTQTYYQADETAARVLHQMTAQRQQIEGANNSVWGMREGKIRSTTMLSLQITRPFSFNYNAM